MKPVFLPRFMKPGTENISSKDSGCDQGQQRPEREKHTGQSGPLDPGRQPPIAGGYSIRVKRNVLVREIRGEAVHNMAAVRTIIHLL